jgi:HEAT repeat protein
VRSSARHRFVKLVEKRDIYGLCRALLDSDPSIRASAANALGEMGDPAAIDSLSGALSDEHPEVRAYVVKALAEIGDPGAVPPLLDALHGLKGKTDSVSRSQTELIVDRLATFGDAAVGPIMDAVASERIARSNGASALGSMKGSEKAVDALLQLVEPDDPGPGRSSLARDIAIAGLGRVGTPSAIHALAKLLTDATSPRTREKALDVLGSNWKPRTAREAVWGQLTRLEDPTGKRYHGGGVPQADPYVPWTVPYARPLLSDWGPEITDHIFAALDRDDFLRPECVPQLLWGLADQLDERAIGPLATLADSQDPEVAYYATCALINIQNDEVTPVLARIARTSRAWKVQKAVGTKTSPYDRDDVWPVWREVRVDNSAQRQIAEVERKRRTSSPSAPTPVDDRRANIEAATEAQNIVGLLTLLGAAFRSDDRKVADKITRSLEKVGATDLAALSGGLLDEMAMVRWVCAQTLGKVGSLDAVPALRATLDDPDDSVREAAEVAIERIESRISR